MAMEAALRCAICNEFLSNPHSLQCGHSFCSECIRRHLDQTINPTTSGICPSCRAPAAVAQLRPEKTLVELVAHFRSSRPSLLALVRNSGSGGGGATSAAVSAAAGPGASAVPSNKKPVKGTFSLKKLAQPHFYKQSRESVKSALERLTDGAGAHLRTDGDKDALERRYKDFVHINNAQLDAPEPLSVEQVVAEVHRRENARITEAKRATKTSAAVEAMRNGQIPTEAKSSFADLIKKAREHKASLSKKSENEPSSSSSDKTNESEAASQVIVGSSEIDDWRMVMSDKLGKVFYYNVRTKIGQFAIPAVFENSSEVPELADDEDTAIAENSMHVQQDSVDSSIDTRSPQRNAAVSSQSINLGASPGQTPTQVATQVATQYPSEARRMRSPAARSSPHSSTNSPDASRMDLQSSATQECATNLRSNEISAEAGASQLTPAAAGAQADGAEEETEWGCAQCTFINAAGMSVCEMCLAIRPRSKASLRHSQKTMGESESSKRPRR